MDEQSDRPTPTQPSSPGGGARLLAVLGVLLALMAGAGVAWLWIGLQDARLVQARLEQALARVPSPAPDRSADLLAQLESAQAAQAALEARAAALEDAQRALQAGLARRDGADRRLAEAEYLQRLAAQSLLMGREVRGAIALLEASDEILRAYDDPALHPARALLARDLAALRGIASIDVEGGWLRLAALSASVPGLVLAERHLPVADDALASAPEPAGWSARVLALLERFVIVRRDVPPAQTLLPAVDEQMLRMSVRLALEQAKLALLAAEQEAYAGALADAGALVRGRFDPAAAPNRAFLEELARLGAARIAPPLPDLSESLRALRDVAQAQRDAG